MTRLLCAAFVLGLASLGCGKAPAVAMNASSAAVIAGDASVDLVPMATCPEDSTWTGAVCMGHGYLACPAGMHLDGHQRCASSAPLHAEHADAGAADDGD